MKKRLIAVILAVIMVLGMSAVTVYANSGSSKHVCPDCGWELDWDLTDCDGYAWDWSEHTFEKGEWGDCEHGHANMGTLVVATVPAGGVTTGYGVHKSGRTVPISARAPLYYSKNIAGAIADSKGTTNPLENVNFKFLFWTTNVGFIADPFSENTTITLPGWDHYVAVAIAHYAYIGCPGGDPVDPEETEPEETDAPETPETPEEPEATVPASPLFPAIPNIPCWTLPDCTKPDCTEPEATEPECTEPEATEPECTEPEETKPADDAEKVEVTLNYDANGGTGTMAPDTAVAGEDGKAAFTVKENAFTAPDGKEFAGWNTKADGTGVAIEAGSEIFMTADGTLYAIWKDVDSAPKTSDDMMILAWTAACLISAAGAVVLFTTKRKNAVR